MTPAPLDIPAWLASLLLEQERDRWERERRVQPEIPAPTTQEEDVAP